METAMADLHRRYPLRRLRSAKTTPMTPDTGTTSATVAKKMAQSKLDLPGRVRSRKRR
jgi:hypothetical protein